MSDSLEIRVRRDSYCDVQLTFRVSDAHHYDRDVVCPVDISLGIFGAKIVNELVSSENLLAFTKALEQVYETLEDTATLSLNELLFFSFTGNGRGRIKMSGLIQDAQQSELRFQFAIDQTYLPAVIQQSRAIIETLNKL